LPKQATCNPKHHFCHHQAFKQVDDLLTHSSLTCQLPFSPAPWPIRSVIYLRNSVCILSALLLVFSMSSFVLKTQVFQDG
jgi:hypothetical protein